MKMDVPCAYPSRRPTLFHDSEPCCPETDFVTEPVAEEICSGNHVVAALAENSRLLIAQQLLSSLVLVLSDKATLHIGGEGCLSRTGYDVEYVHSHLETVELAFEAHSANLPNNPPIKRTKRQDEKSWLT